MVIHTPQKQTSSRPWLIRGGLLVLAAAAIGWHFYGKSGQDAMQAPAAMPVSVITVQPESVRVWTDFSGRLHPVDTAEIRPEVSGRIVKVLFTDGQQVKKGDTLFVIEPGPYEAAVARAEAALATARSNAHFTAIDKKRAAEMVRNKAIAKRTYDERANADSVAVASIKAAEAELKQARIDLDHAYIKAPIDGKLSRAELTVGNVVQAGPSAPLLTSIVSNDRIYADLEIDEQHYLQTLRASKDAAKIAVKLKVKGLEKPIEGFIQSFDNQINVTNGTIRARAEFANENGALLPGMFVTVSIANAEDSKVIRVPEQTIGYDQEKKFVYTVDAKNTVAYNEITTGESVDGLRIVTGGLKAGDKVITSSLQMLRPGAPVLPQDANAAKAAPASAKAEEKQP